MHIQTSITLAVAMATIVSLTASAAPAGRVVFAQPGAEIVNGQGARRIANRGDLVEAGERLVTPLGVMAQVQLSDGSLLGMRPGSELKLDMVPLVNEKGGAVVSLLEGSLRVISSELMDAKKPSSLTLLAGQATLKLAGADLESAMVNPRDVKRPDAENVGSYSRLLTGSGSISNGSLVELLAIRQVSFVGPGDKAPLIVASSTVGVFTQRQSLSATDLPAIKAVPGTAEPVPSGVFLPAKNIAPLIAPVLPGRTLTAPLISPPLVAGLSPATAPQVSSLNLNRSVSVAVIAPTVPQNISVINVVPVVPRSTIVTTNVKLPTVKTCTSQVIKGIKACI